MKQKCVQFHTIKSYYNTLKILKKEEFEILFSDTTADIDFESLTIEEQISWIETMENDQKHYDKFLKKHAGKFDDFFESVMDFRKQTVDLVKSYRNNPSSYKTSEKFEHFIKMRKKISNGINLNTLFFLGNEIFRDHMKVRCSCIIAKKGTNIARYLSFQKDPIVTLIGPKAKNLKSYLEKKF